MNNDYENRIWEIASVIKIVANMDITAICNVARKVNKHFSPEDIETLNNELLYECYLQEVHS